MGNLLLAAFQMSLRFCPAPGSCAIYISANSTVIYKGQVLQCRMKSFSSSTSYVCNVNFFLYFSQMHHWARFFFFFLQWKTQLRCAFHPGDKHGLLSYSLGIWYLSKDRNNLYKEEIRHGVSNQGGPRSGQKISEVAHKHLLVLSGPFEAVGIFQGQSRKN